MEITPISFEEANEFILRHHRHHKPTPGYKFVLAVSEDDIVHGVAIVGRPIARFNDDGWTLEVNRCCTDGAKNACSMLYAAAWRAARAIGYKRLITYSLPSESGASLRGAGWKIIGQTKDNKHGWNSPSRPRVEINKGVKLIWEKSSNV